MAPNFRINAVAFISPQNHPILIRTFSKQDENAIKYHYIAHTSLDVIEERGQSQQHSLVPESSSTVIASAKSIDCYLGLLYSMEDVAVYGYITPLKVKIVIALALTDSVVRDVEIALVISIMSFGSLLSTYACNSLLGFQSSAYGILFCHLKPIPNASRFGWCWAG